MSMLFFYKILFMIELLISEYLFAFRMKKKKHFILRVIGAWIFSLAISALYPLPLKYAYTSWYSTIMFIILFVVAFFHLKFVFNISWSYAFFCAIASYTIRHFAYGIYVLIFSTFGWINSNDPYSSNPLDFANFDQRTIIIILSYLDIFLFCYWGGYILFASKLKTAETIKFKSTTLLLFTGLILIVDIVINAIVTYSTDNVFKDRMLYFYNILCCALVFYIEYNLINTKDMSNEMAIMQEALRHSQKQYDLQKENIKLINLKCHDLKHQINEYALKGKINQEFVKEIQEAISIYDANINTGNEVLDIILTEKSLLCNEKGIVLTCMVSQCDLSFIKEGELYSFFGNILDNAINAVSLINNKEKRCIGVNIHQIEKFIAIKVDNYFSGDIDLSSDGLPLTKKDTNYHGFGMQSIKMIVDKYNGTLNIEIDEDVFILNVIFPTK